MNKPLTSGAYLHLYVDGEVYLPRGRKGIGIHQFGLSIIPMLYFRSKPSLSSLSSKS
jgi:hypothetical protein